MSSSQILNVKVELGTLKYLKMLLRLAIVVPFFNKITLYLVTAADEVCIHRQRGR